MKFLMQLCILPIFRLLNQNDVVMVLGGKEVPMHDQLKWRLV